MIKVVVKPAYKVEEFSDAAGWHIDDVSQLHVRGPKREDGSRAVIASYARGDWASVRIESEGEGGIS